MTAPKRLLRACFQITQDWAAAFSLALYFSEDNRLRPYEQSFGRRSPVYVVIPRVGNPRLGFSELRDVSDEDALDATVELRRAVAWRKRAEQELKPLKNRREVSSTLRSVTKDMTIEQLVAWVNED